MPGLPQRGPGALNLPADLGGDDRRRQPGGRAGHRRDDARQDRAACDDGAFAGVRQAAQGDTAGILCLARGSRAWARRRSRPCTRRWRSRAWRTSAPRPRPGAIAKLKGFGAKTEANILEGIAFLETTGGRILQHEALRLVAPDPRGRPRASPGHPGRGLRQPAAPGRDDRRPGHPLQRRRTRPRSSKEFVALPQVAKVLATGPTKASVLCRLQVRPVRPVRPPRASRTRQFPFALHYFTGSKAHNIAIGKRALARGLTLNEYALAGTEGPVACRDRGRPVRGARAGRDSPRAARGCGRDRGARRSGPLPELVTRGDLTGTFHCHTDWSDGGATRWPRWPRPPGRRG